MKTEMKTPTNHYPSIVRFTFALVLKMKALLNKSYLVLWLPPLLVAAHLDAAGTLQFSGTSYTVDYTTLKATLTFAPLETERTISIPILDDGLVEGDETLTLTLSNASPGVALRDSTLPFAPGQ